MIGSTIARRFLSAAAPAAKRTELYSFHIQRGGKMVQFAGWDMPVQYKDLSLINSHRHTRENASLFDVSHMLQFTLTGRDREKFIETVTVADMAALPEGAGTLSVFTNENGGVIDDTVVLRNADHLYVVANAGCADKDLAHLNAQLAAAKSKGADVQLNVLTDVSLWALQGPKAAAALQAIVAGNYDLSKLKFMHSAMIPLRTAAGEVTCRVTRCGYTGEDGFEISVPHRFAAPLGDTLLENSAVKLAGLGARDSLRLEAGLNLYGHELDETILPAEAGLAWCISERRRKEGGFLGHAKVVAQLKGGADFPPKKKRVGLTLEGSAARGGNKITDANGVEIGVVTSGCPAPSLGLKPISIAYVTNEHSKIGTPVSVEVAGNQRAAVVAKMPFVPHRYYRG